MKLRLFVARCAVVMGVFFMGTVVFFTNAVVFSTDAVANADALDPSKDYHSFANTHAVITTHLALDLQVNFDKKILQGSVTHTLKRIPDTSTDSFILDTRALTITKVESFSTQWRATKFLLREAHPALGSALEIALPSDASKIRVHYHTSPAASGLQWLTPEQTGGKQHPFLFSQAQAIHARSFIPVQDTPQVRVTYDAKIRTPKKLRAVMSAENDPMAPRSGEYTFHMPQAVPSYLIALAVGDIDFKAMGKRTGVYAEPYIIDAAVKEFNDTEAMLEATEAKFGAYAWGRYDLLILPPSFPYGGMENPRLSFITPTVIAGDKSLVSLIAHELAHSWSGNAVTNATWRDLWLNEGFTTYLTYRIMDIIYGERRFHMESVLGYQDLEEALATVATRDQVLAIDLRDRDPYDVFSNIPYEKGALLLKELENAVGRDAFDVFLKQYFSDYAFRSLHTEEFLRYLDIHLIRKFPDKLSLERVHRWVYEPGIPADAPQPSSDAFTLVADKREKWLEGTLIAKKIKTQDWTVHEWLYFLNALPEKLTKAQLYELDSAFQLTQSTNSEIAHSWLLIAIRNQYTEAYPRLEEYLLSIGRRKLIKPLYQELLTTPEGAKFARRVFAKARAGYHPLAQRTMDAIVNPARELKK